MPDSKQPFYLASKTQLREYGLMSAQSRRSPQLKKAYAEKELIKQRHENGEWPRSLAKEYDIPLRAIYRVIKDAEVL